MGEKVYTDFSALKFFSWATTLFWKHRLKDLKSLLRQKIYKI